MEKLVDIVHFLGLKIHDAFRITGNYLLFLTIYHCFFYMKSISFTSLRSSFHCTYDLNFEITDIIIWDLLIYRAFLWMHDARPHNILLTRWIFWIHVIVTNFSVLLLKGKLYFYQIVGEDQTVKRSVTSHQRLGSAGLALHYANIITQIDTLVSSFFSIYLNNHYAD